MRLKLLLSTLAASFAAVSASAGTITAFDTTYFSNVPTFATVAPGTPNGTSVSSIGLTDGQSIGLSSPLVKDNETVHPVENPFTSVYGIGTYRGDVFRGLGTIRFTIPSDAFGFYIAPNIDQKNKGNIQEVRFFLNSVDSPDYHSVINVFPYDPNDDFGRSGFFGFYGGGAHVFELTENDYSFVNGRPVLIGPDTVFGYTVGYITAGLPSIIVTSVPEPATFVVFGAGLAGLGLIRRRR